MKRISAIGSVLLTAAIGVVFSGPSAFAATPPDSCFAFDSGTGTIQYYFDYEDNNPANPACPKDVDIPAALGGGTDPVATIASGAFSNKQLTAVTIPNSVTSIGSAAFSANQLTSVTLPNSVTGIGSNAFGNNQLTSVTLSNSLVSIASIAFYQNQLTSVTIPDSVTSIGDGAFETNQLSSVTLSNSLTSIGSRAFYQNQLASVAIPNSVASIGSQAFMYNQLTSVTLPNSLTSIDNVTFAFNRLTSVTIPNSVTSLDGSAFMRQNSEGRDLTDLDTIWYARLYTQDLSNPNNLQDGFNQLINPAQISIEYENGAGTALRPTAFGTGTGGLTSYLVSENTDNDLDRYYRIGDTVSFTAPGTIGEYRLQSPASPHTFTFAAADGSNTLTFLYANEDSSAPAAPDAGVRTDEGISLSAVLLSGMAVAITGLTLRRYRRHIQG